MDLAASWPVDASGCGFSTGTRPGVRACVIDVFAERVTSVSVQWGIPSSSYSIIFSRRIEFGVSR